MHRFFISQIDAVDEAQAVICSEDLIHQFSRVLRFARGERVILLNNSGYEFVVELQDFSAKKIVGKVLEKKFCETELPVRLVIALAILKNMERFEWALQKGAELGVSAFIPLITDRTERKALGKVERLQRILKEAAEQSGRGKVPELLVEQKFEKIFRRGKFFMDGGGDEVERVGGGDEPENRGRLIVVPHPGVEQKFSEFCREKLVGGAGKFSGELVICVGPEGGFTDSEIEIAKSRGAHLVSLGNRILRAETVPLVMSALVDQYLEEVGTVKIL